MFQTFENAHQRIETIRRERRGGPIVPTTDICAALEAAIVHDLPAAAYRCPNGVRVAVAVEHDTVMTCRNAAPINDYVASKAARIQRSPKAV